MHSFLTLLRVKRMQRTKYDHTSSETRHIPSSGLTFVLKDVSCYVGSHFTLDSERDRR